MKGVNLIMNTMKGDNLIEEDKGTLEGMSKSFSEGYDKDPSGLDIANFDAYNKKRITEAYNESLKNIDIEEQSFVIALKTFPELEEDLKNANILYLGIVRRVSGEDYVNHIIGVAKIVSRITINREIILGALMHDVIEDVVKGKEKLLELYDNDLELIELVESVSEEDKSLSWLERKEAYISHLDMVGSNSLIISLSDRIHNLRDMISSIEKYGIGIFDNFNAGFNDQKDFLFNYSFKISEIISGMDESPMKLNIEKLYDEICVLISYFSILGKK